MVKIKIFLYEIKYFAAILYIPGGFPFKNTRDSVMWKLSNNHVIGELQFTKTTEALDSEGVRV